MNSLPTTGKERYEATEQFLAELGKLVPEDERIMVGYAPEATTSVEKDGKKSNSGWWPEPYRQGKALRPQSNCYVQISSSKKTLNEKTGKMRYWRGDASFGRGVALMVDDVGSGAGSKGSLTIEHFDAILRPTAVVETSPDNYQLWYMLSEAVDDLRLFKSFLSCFVSSVLGKGGDNTIKDAARYGRMPYGINNKRHGPGKPYKYVDDKGDNFKPRLHRLPEYGNRYTIQEIANKFRFQITTPVIRGRDPSVDAALEQDREYFLEQAHNEFMLQKAIEICSELRLGEGSDGVARQNMSGKYRIKCPWCDEHGNGDPFGAYFRGPVPGAEYDYVFGCGHDTHRKGNGHKTWFSFIDELIMPRVYDRLERINKAAAK